MDWQVELGLALRAILAAVLGGFIGWEREQERRVAGVRTFAAVSLGACIFGLISSHMKGEASPRTALPPRWPPAWVSWAPA